MAVAIPQAVLLPCPRCRTTRRFLAIDGATTFRCAGCEWFYTLSAVAPTGAATATLPAGGTAITVASGGASFTAGMLILYDTGQLTEILTVTATGTALSIPVSAAVRGHASAAPGGTVTAAVTT